MTRLRISVSKPQFAPRPRPSPGLTAQSLLAVEQRLVATERELRIQFTRIAQLQAELDLLTAALRRVTDADPMTFQAECVRLNRGLEHSGV